MKILFVVLFCFGVATTVFGAVDQTLVPGASGRDVAESAAKKITNSNIFPSDFNFLRRIAIVESDDGKNPNTYRTGYNGGIWQVDEIGFIDTQNVASHPALNAAFNDIKAEFGIDWAATTWADLRKPLYSALAARLLLFTKPSAIPPDLDSQAQYWKDFYNTNSGAGTPQDFIDRVKAVESKSSCVSASDIMFVLDSSGSIIPSDFSLELSFAGDFVNKSNVGATTTRFGVINFSSVPIVEFTFDTFASKTEIVTAIGSIVQIGATTGTDSAINQATALFASDARPLNSGTSRIMIVVTDGVSNDPFATSIAAEAARAAKISTFAVGVGFGANPIELEAIAGAPSRVLAVNGFNLVASLQSVISSSTCATPATVSKDTKIEGVVNEGESRFFSSEINEDGLALDLKIQSGKVNVYASYSFESPSSAVNDFAQEGSGLLNIPFGNSPTVFFAIQGAQENSQFEISVVDFVPSSSAIVSLECLLTMSCILISLVL